MRDETLAELKRRRRAGFRFERRIWTVFGPCPLLRARSAGSGIFFGRSSHRQIDPPLLTELAAPSPPSTSSSQGGEGASGGRRLFCSAPSCRGPGCQRRAARGGRHWWAAAAAVRQQRPCDGELTLLRRPGGGVGDAPAGAGRRVAELRGQQPVPRIRMARSRGGGDPPAALPGSGPL